MVSYFHPGFVYLNNLLTTIDVTRPIALFDCWVEKEPRCAACFVMKSSNTSAKTLWTTSFWVESVSVIARNSFTDWLWFSCVFWLNIAIFIIFIANKSISTVNSTWPITLHIRETKHQLLSIGLVTRMMLCNISVTLPVFHAVFRIFKKSIRLWTLEVIALTTFIIAGSTVTIPLSTANVGGEITPSMNRVKQIVVFACDVI